MYRTWASLTGSLSISQNENMSLDFLSRHLSRTALSSKTQIPAYTVIAKVVMTADKRQSCLNGSLSILMHTRLVTLFLKRETTVTRFPKFESLSHFSEKYDNMSRFP